MHVQYAAPPLRLDPDARYQAGACNIGPAEIASRRRAGMIGLAIAAAIAIAILILDLPSWARLLVFLPLAGGLISLEQVRRRFCVGFAMAGLRNFGPLGTPDKVTDASDLAADRRAALIVVAYCSAVAAVVTLAFVAIG